MSLVKKYINKVIGQLKSLKNKKSKNLKTLIHKFMKFNVEIEG